MDPLVELARRSIHHYVRTGQVLETVPPELAVALGGKAAVFVSLHSRNGELRGCKGTLSPFHDTLAEEILHTAISACAHDPRFPPVTAPELDGLAIHVDVLSELEPIPDWTGLDPRHYGVVVSTGDGRRGVLLPDLEGVDTVDQQLSIACRKAGIDSRREPYALQRFTVVRHTA